MESLMQLGCSAGVLRAQCTKSTRVRLLALISSTVALVINHQQVLAQSSLDSTRIMSAVCGSDGTIMRYPQPIALSFKDLVEMDASEKTLRDNAIQDLARRSDVIIRRGVMDASFNSFINAVTIPNEVSRFTQDVADDLDAALQADLQALGLLKPSTQPKPRISSEIRQLYLQDKYTRNYSLKKGGIPFYTLLVIRSFPFELRQDLAAQSSLLAVLAYNGNAPSLPGNIFESIAKNGFEGTIGSVDYEHTKFLYNDKAATPVICKR